MRRVLMIAYYFPPLGGIGSLRALAVARHLPKFGWEPTVLAPSKGAYYRDPSLSFPHDRVVRTRSIELSRVGKRVLRAGGDDVEPAVVGSVRSAPRALVRRWLYFPDAQVGWYPGAVAAARRLISEGAFDAIYSTSFPITAHLVARTVRRRARIPWVAEFRDPWSLRMLEGVDHRRQRAERLERSIASEASAVVMPSPSWAAEHSRMWDRTVMTIPNGFGYVPPGSPPRDEVVVCYLGTYYPGRQNLSAVWKALARLAADPSSPRVRLRIVGEAPAAMRAELRANGVESLLEVTGFLGHDAALRRAASASVLLAAGPARSDGAAGEGWLQAKLFEYLATGLPILWVGMRPNDGASLLTSHPGCRILRPDDPDAVAEALREEAGTRYRRELGGLSWTERAAALANLFDGHYEPLRIEGP